MTFRTIGRSKAPNWSGIVSEIDKTMGGPVRQRLPEYPRKVVADWKHQPEFTAEKRREPDAIVVRSEAAGANAKFWEWVHGTRPHKIRAKNAPMLVFPAVNAPKTKPPAQHGLPSGSSGPTVFAKEVNHPGTEPRQFGREWAKLALEWFVPLIREAVERGVRRA